MTLRKRVIGLTVVAWLLACAIYEFVTISSFLASPPPTDAYAVSWSFQLIVFAVFRFPIWLGALGLLLGAELFFFRRSDTPTPSVSSDSEATPTATPNDRNA